MEKTLTKHSSHNKHMQLFICPFCSEEIPLIVKIIKDANNIYLKLKCSCLQSSTSINWFDYYQRINKEVTKKTCNSHSTVQGSKYCINCNKWVCLECLRNHQKWNHSFLNQELHINCLDHPSYTLDYYCLQCNKNVCKKCKENYKMHNIKKVSSFNYNQFKRKYNNLDNIIKSENDQFNVYAFRAQYETFFLNVKEAYEINQICNTQLKEIITIMVDTYEYTKSYPNFSLISNLSQINFSSSSPLKEIPEDEGDAVYNLLNNLIIDVTHSSERLALCQDNYSKTAQSILVLNNEQVAISNSEIIRLYEINNKSFKPLSLLKGHKGYINCLVELKDGRIASGSIDKTIKLWNLKTYECEYTLEDSHPIRCLLQLKDGRLLASKWDMYNQMSVYNVSFSPTPKCIQTKYTYLEIRYWLQFTSGVIATAMESTIALLDQDTFETTGIMEIVNNIGQQKETIKIMIELQDGRLVTASKYNVVRIWNVETMQCQIIIQIDDSIEPQPIRKLLQLTNGRLIICKNTDIDLYDLKLMKHMGLMGRVSQDIKLITQTVNGNLLCLTDTPVKLWSIDLLE